MAERVVGLDNLDPYYDVRLKQARLERLCAHDRFRFERLDLTDREALASLLDREADIAGIVHLAAQAGVRHSLVDPYAYVQANVLGQVTLAGSGPAAASPRPPRLCLLILGVRGSTSTCRFAESERVDRPGSLYAATKRSAELISHAYGHLFGLPQTGLRFFTVYGPWGTPRTWRTTPSRRAILDGTEITLYEGEGLARDFTYVDDVVDGVLRVLDHPPAGGDAPGRTFNLGNDRPEPVALLVSLLEQALGRVARVRRIPRPATDIEATWASVDAVETLTGWRPSTRLEDGIPRFVDWFRSYATAG